MTLGAAQIEEAVIKAGLEPISSEAAGQFARFADLLVRWNARMNLTAIRTPAEILQHHFLECIFCAQQLPGEAGTVLDFGSGAGFPGIPIAICRPEVRVTLAESQGKKAAFLREAMRTLGLRAEVFGGRVETMDGGRRFDVVTMRAVDKMAEATRAASERVVAGGWLAVLATGSAEQVLTGFNMERRLAVPGARSRELQLWRHVPRGTE